MDGMGPWMLGGLLFGVVIVASFVGLIAYLAARASGGPQRSADAVDVLKLRLARGELDRAEYEERLALLRGEASAERPHN